MKWEGKVGAALAYKIWHYVTPTTTVLACILSHREAVPNVCEAIPGRHSC